jgi:hypothetical protein
MARRAATGRVPACLGSPHAPEGASRGDADLAFTVIGEIEEHLEDGWPWAGAATGIGAHLGIAILEKVKQGLDGQSRLEPCGNGDGDLACGALDNALGDQSGHRARRLRAADQGEGVERCGLLRHNALEAEPRKASAELLQSGNRGDQPAPPGFGCQVERFRQPRPGDRCDERAVV